MDDCLARIDMTVPLHVPAHVLVQKKLIATELGDFAQLYRKAVTDWPRLTGAPVEEVSGSGHFIQKERPEAVIDAIAAVSTPTRWDPKTGMNDGNGSRPDAGG
jgi:hypothetical protein